MPLTLPWEMEVVENILATHMLDTVVPAIVHHVWKSSQSIKTLNKELVTNLRLSKKELLLDFERDQRIRIVLAWRLIRTHVFDGLHDYLFGLSKLVDVLQTDTATATITREHVEDAYENAVVLADGCRSARNQAEDVARIYKQLGEVFQIIRDRPKTGYRSYFGLKFPSRTITDILEHIINVNGELEASSVRVHESLKELGKFFATVVKDFSPDTMNPSWADGLDLASLRDRWTRLQGEIREGQKVMDEAAAAVSTLPAPL